MHVEYLQFVSGVIETNLQDFNWIIVPGIYYISKNQSHFSISFHFKIIWEIVEETLYQLWKTILEKV